MTAKLRNIARGALTVISLSGALCGIASEPVVEFITPTIVRVRWNPDGVLTDNNTGACVYEGTYTGITRKDEGGRIILSSDSLTVTFGGEGAIEFRDAKTGHLLLSESASNPRDRAERVREKVIYDEASARMEDTANGKVTVKDVVRRDTIGTETSYTVNFTTGADEALYGLGSHIEDYMNLAGKTLYLTQHNLKAFVPVLVSTGGYGLLFDAGCSMKFASRINEAQDENEISMEMNAADILDYYFIKGYKPEETLAGYRYLTGAVSLMPLYLFGYIQSKERYVSSADLIATLKEYRRRHVPIDMIVQDWNYWPQGWGYMKMNREYYPDPKALADSIHALNGKLMVSIWPNPQYCPEEEDFRGKGFMLEHSVVDVFNPAARDLYWEYADKEFFSNGFDAWWCDSSEPLDGDWNKLPEPENGEVYTLNSHERRWRLNDEVLSESLGAKRACLYSLNHSRGIYEHQRGASDEKRVVNLTRSTFAGQQRYGTVVWNGDTYASWESFRRQIPAGLNYMATGNPYWTVDIGCFFTKTDPRWFYKGEFPRGVEGDDYKEFYTRMFQWATFLPVTRSHGTDTPREIWRFGEPGTPYYDAILGMINLRYSLLPYIYSMNALQTQGGYSMVRPLAFDYPEDKETHDIADQYMFGDIMVCPVTEGGAESRKVYLPDATATWTDFHTGEKLPGGRMTDASAPIDKIPLFVREGSIITSTAPAEYSGAIKGQPVEVRIYPGRDAEFVYYDDNGDGYGYEKGENRRINLRWDDKARKLEITPDGGDYPGAPKELTFVVSDGVKSKKCVCDGRKKIVKL